MIKIMIFCVIYGALFGTTGALLQQYQIITQPAYWAAYGLVYGVVGCCLTLMFPIQATK